MAKSRTILVIDDRASHRDLLRSLLTYAGHRVVTANDGLEGLERAREQRPDLIICDVLMPIMDGYEFVRQLRLEPQIADTEVVLSTAYFHEHEAYRLAQRVGVRRVLSKPCEPDELLSLIEQIFSQPPEISTPSADQDLDRQQRRLFVDQLIATANTLERVDRTLIDYVDLNLALAELRSSDSMAEALANGAKQLLSARYAVAAMYSPSSFADTAAFVVGYRSATDSAAWREFDPLRLKAADCAPGVDGAIRFLGQPNLRQLAGLPAHFPPFKQAIAVPILSPDRRYGWLLLADSVDGHDFSEREAALIATLAAHAGRIYENQQLLERARRHADQLQTEVAMRIGMQRRVELQYAVAKVFVESEGFDQAINQLLKALVERLDVDSASLWERDRTNRCLRRLALAIRVSGVAAISNSAPRLLRIGEDVVGESWGGAQPVWRVDEQLGTRLAFPLQMQDDVIGAIELASDEVRPWSGEFIDSLTAIGSQIAQFLERRSQYAQIRRLNRIHAVLSSINAILVRVRERSEVLNQACQIAVREGGFQVAWIALAETADAPLRVWARHSDNHDLQLANAEPGRYPHRLAEAALATGQIVCSNDLFSEPQLPAGECGEAMAAGMRAYAALPLIAENGERGVLSLYSSEPDVFHPGELTLLAELAEDIAFALSTIYTRELLDYSEEHDAVTGLLSRQGFLHRLSQVLEQYPEHPRALFCCDLKRFRQINESLGRAAGDAMLGQFAQRLQRHWADCADIARLGGDVFAALILRPRQLNERVQRFVEWSSQDLGGAFDIGGQQIATRARLGVALFPGDANDAASLLQKAESALQNCKLSGQHYLFFRPEMTARVADSLRLESRLRGAIRDQRLRLHYQPKLSLASGELRGLEALLRWTDDELGDVPPNAFVPLLEETGLILEVGDWAMRQALNDVRRCAHEGNLPLRVAVNVSALQLAQPDFVPRVLKICTGDVAGARQLELEVTESLLMHDVEANIQKLRSLGEAGVDTAIDDFGTGYSSLAYLARLPVRALKIDRSFVNGVLELRESRLIVSTTISLAHSLGLDVVAEGVEQEAQAELLREWQCDEIQGYWICKPMPIDALISWMRDYRANDWSSAHDPASEE
ncbi:EAL domain-containing protein [Pseudomarimonas arenosa]|uniref:EAL domain-containing protein n=1 Tax=Pseudomarimonas arenosa TaxID=2774145 RepID=A0AAW3ZUJ9_9GAMM|nr:EAL domain-containing protein [Pseudomarimonas arenosa]MBD8527766.1 EAL domain-containing protein [Pseudomarimonas arenosa]